MKDLLSFGLISKKQAGMTLSSFPPSGLKRSNRPRAAETPAITCEKSTKTPTPEHWQAHAGVIVDDALNGLKLMSVPLFVFGAHRAFSEGVLSAGLGYMSVWPILEVLTPRKEVLND